MSRIKYNFPKNKRADGNLIADQIEKLTEELDEIKEAWGDPAGTNDQVIEETMDLIYACEGLLRKFPKKEVDAIYQKVIDKAESRNDII